MNEQEYYSLQFTGDEIDGKLNKIESLAEKSEIPTKLSELENDEGYITELPILKGKTSEITPSAVRDALSNGYKVELCKDDNPNLLYSSFVVRSDEVIAYSVYDCDSLNGIINSIILVGKISTDIWSAVYTELVTDGRVAKNINTHNTAEDSHEDIRTKISSLTTKFNSYDSVLSVKASQAANSAIASHNQSTDAHSDIRQRLELLGSKQEIVDAVLEKLPTWDGGSY